MQLAAAIAAHRDQADIRVPLKAVPGMAQNQVGKMGPLIDQLVNIFTLVKALVEMVVGEAQCGAEDVDRARDFRYPQQSVSHQRKVARGRFLDAWLVFLVGLFVAGGEDFDAGAGDDHSVLPLGGEPAVAGLDGPAIGLDLGAVLAGVDHGLNGEGHAFLENQSGVRLAVVQYLRLLMELHANAVTAVVADH